MSILGSDDIKKVRIFCKNPSYKNWASLSKASRKTLVDYSPKDSSKNKSYNKVIIDNTSAYNHIDNLESNLAALQGAITELSDKQEASISETSEKIDRMLQNIQNFERQNTRDDVMTAIDNLKLQIDNKFQEYSSKLESINNQPVNNNSNDPASNDLTAQEILNMNEKITKLTSENEQLRTNLNGPLSSILSALVDTKKIKESEKSLVEVLKNKNSKKGFATWLRIYKNALNDAFNEILTSKELKLEEVKAAQAEEQEKRAVAAAAAAKAAADAMAATEKEIKNAAAIAAAKQAKAAKQQKEAADKKAKAEAAQKRAEAKTAKAAEEALAAQKRAEAKTAKAAEEALAAQKRAEAKTAKAAEEAAKKAAAEATFLAAKQVKEPAADRRRAVGRHHISTGEEQAKKVAAAKDTPDKQVKEAVPAAIAASTQSTNTTNESSGWSLRDYLETARDEAEKEDNKAVSQLGKNLLRFP